MVKNVGIDSVSTCSPTFFSAIAVSGFRSIVMRPPSPLAAGKYNFSSIIVIIYNHLRPFANPHERIA
jgi:hypothetical protein